MKKQPFVPLIVLTIVFFAFLTGFLAGRRFSGEAVLVSVPEQMLTPAPTVPETENEIVFPIDLNMADEAEIMALPGIGKTLTMRILAYRRERGRFFSLDDLRKVEGITDSIIDKIRDLVYVGG